MVMRYARIALRPSALNPDVSIEIDGAEYKNVARAIDVHADAGGCPCIELTLNVGDIDLDTAADVRVDPQTAILLRKLGWSPPC